MRGEASSASHTALRLATKASRKELHVLTAASSSQPAATDASALSHELWAEVLKKLPSPPHLCAAVLLAVGGAMLAGDAMSAVDGAASDAASGRAELAKFRWAQSSGLNAK